MPDTGMFYLYEVAFHPDTGPQSAPQSIEFIRAECNGCRRMFQARSAPLLENVAGGGAVLSCPSCGERQAISIARFVDFVARFPHGNVDSHRAAAVSSPM